MDNEKCIQVVIDFFFVIDVGKKVRADEQVESLEDEK